MKTKEKKSVDKTRRNQERHRAKRWLLTYSRVDLEVIHHTMIVELIHNMGGRIRIASENHKDGAPHYHAYIEFKKAQNSRDMRRFDVANHHPRIDPVEKTPWLVWEYLVKNCDGNGDKSGELLYDDFPEPPTGRRKAGAGKAKKSEILDMYEQASRANTKEDALNIIKEQRADHYWTRSFAIEHAAEKLFPAKADTSYDGPTLAELGVRWSDYPELKCWVDKYLPSVFDEEQPEERWLTDSGPPSLTPDDSSMSGTSLFGGEDESMDLYGSRTESIGTSSPVQEYVIPHSEVGLKLSAAQHRPRPKILILYGPTRTGKTLLGRALGSHMYHAGKFNINVCTTNVDYAVFDDLKDGFHSAGFDYKSWMGGQNEFTIDGKWVRETKFVWNSKPCIYICNRDPIEGKEGVIKGVDYDWIRDNSVSVYVGDALHRMALEQM